MCIRDRDDTVIRLKKDSEISSEFTRELSEAKCQKLKQEKELTLQMIGEFMEKEYEEQYKKKHVPGTKEEDEIEFRQFKFESIKYDYPNFDYRSLYNSMHYDSNEFLSKFLKLKNEEINFMNPLEYNTKFQEMQSKGKSDVIFWIKTLKDFCKSRRILVQGKCKNIKICNY